uniref:sensor histidine kinase n=1 Tax=Thaumasiovibrio occultus TaxID=1891184 RepID=UPI000B35DE05|nr:HAMP domain-containing sensor histidine kinase [Thaumasiovibrio occultus]
MDKATDSKHKHFPSIYRRVRWSFGIITLVMFTLFWSLIYVAENKFEVLSLHHWLDTEAELYRTNFAQQAWDAPKPNPLEFDSFWSESKTPDWLLKFDQPGFYEKLLGTEDKHFVVFAHPSGKGLMYIVFQDDSDDYLDDYESSLHQFTFALGGLLSLLMLAYGIYMVRILSKPLSIIEKKIHHMAPDAAMFEVETRFSETRQIEQALLDSKVDIALFFQREKEFSRFASHELRTPIMVIQGSTELLERIPDQPRLAQKAVQRIESATQEMTVLTEAFLLLGKAEIETQHCAQHALAESVEAQLSLLSPLFAKQDATYQLTLIEPGSVWAPESFIAILINNLIKNAFSYSIGDIAITLEETLLTITNRHDGNDTFNAGYGCGLVIVERICTRMGWHFITEKNAQTFIASIDFTAANPAGEAVSAGDDHV